VKQPVSRFAFQTQPAALQSGGGNGPPLDREETKEEYDTRMAREKQLRKADQNALLRQGCTHSRGVALQVAFERQNSETGFST
jgi:hypothetical protein